MEKAFDAVQMKREIQQRLIDEFAGLTPEEMREAQRRRIESDPQMAQFLQHVHTISNSPTSSTR